MSTEQAGSAAPEEPPRLPSDTGAVAAPRRPTAEAMGEWSFPASDPPATWTWELREG